MTGLKNTKSLMLAEATPLGMGLMAKGTAVEVLGLKSQGRKMGLDAFMFLLPNSIRERKGVKFWVGHFEGGRNIRQRRPAT